MASAQLERRPGGQSVRSSLQEAMIRRLVIKCHPGQLKLPAALMTRAETGKLTARKVTIRLSVRAADVCLTTRESTAQKPTQRATERDEAARQAWLTPAYKASAVRPQKGC